MTYIALLRSDHFRALCRARDLTVTDVAHGVGLDRSSVYRNLRGQTIPSNAFIAGCAVMFGEDALPRLFHFAHESEPRHVSGNTFVPVLHRRDTPTEITDEEIAS